MTIKKVSTSQVNFNRQTPSVGQLGSKKALLKPPTRQNTFGAGAQSADLRAAGRPARQGIQRTLTQRSAPTAQAAPAAQAPQAQSAHTVRSGDTLSAIAAANGTTWQELAAHNNLSNPDLIHPGQVINIPGGGQAAPAPGGGTAPAPGGTAAPAPGGATPAPGAAGQPQGPAAVDGPAATQPVTGGVNLQQLRQIMPNVSEARAQEMLPHLNRAMQEAEINTPRRQAAFLAQLAHESGEFRYMEEIASGAAYEGRRDLGNTQPGDGRRFKGRGPIQLTGRHNYTEAGRALGLDLAGNPGQVATPEVGFRTSAWYWNSRDLNRHADSGNFDAVTRGINGGLNGKADRDRYYARALQVLGA